MCSGPPERTGVSLPVPSDSRDVTQGLFAGCMPRGIPQGSRRPVWVRKAETPCFPVEPLPAGGGAFPGGSAPPRAHLSSPLLWKRGLVSCVRCAFRQGATERCVSLLFLSALVFRLLWFPGVSFPKGSRLFRSREPGAGVFLSFGRCAGARTGVSRRIAGVGRRGPREKGLFLPEGCLLVLLGVGASPEKGVVLPEGYSVVVPLGSA